MPRHNFFKPATPQTQDPVVNFAIQKGRERVLKMVLAKSKKSVGLGNTLMNDRFGKGKGSDMRRATHQAGIQRTGQNGEKV